MSLSSSIAKEVACLGVLLLSVSVLPIACATERDEASDGETPIPRLVGAGRSSVNDAHDGPSGFDPASGDLYFTRASHDFSHSRVYRVPWGSDEEPSPASFSTAVFDAGAAFGPGANVVLFTSQRATRIPSLPDNWNLWRAVPGEASATLLPEPMNSSASECCAAFAPDGSFLFSSDRGGSWDIYRARFLEDELEPTVAPLTGSVRSDHDEWPSYVTSDGRLLLFSSTRPGGLGGDDIYVACLQEPAADQWQAHRLGAPINSTAYEDSAILTPDGATLVWSSRRPRGETQETDAALSDIYQLSLAESLLPDCPVTE